MACSRRLSGSITGPSWMSWCARRSSCRLIIGRSWRWSGRAIRTGISGSANFRFHTWTIRRCRRRCSWMTGWPEEAGRLPENRGRWVLKPLYSFAGKGIQFGPSDEELRAIPSEEQHNYLLQERVQFEPVINTPEGLTQAEIRILYVWPDGGRMTPLTSLVRMGRGLMMGVDHNRDRTWVGGSASLTPKQTPW